MQHGAYWIAKKPVGHGTNRLHTSVRSLRVLHDLGPPALGSVNHVETFTSVCNLYILWGKLCRGYTVFPLNRRGIAIVHHIAQAQFSPLILRGKIV